VCCTDVTAASVRRWTLENLNYYHPFVTIVSRLRIQAHIAAMAIFEQEKVSISKRLKDDMLLTLLDE
jgi:hypothetical protein